MRMNKRVTLLQKGEQSFNKDTGNYDTEEGERTVVPASIMDMSDERMDFLFGGIQTQAYTIIVLGDIHVGVSNIQIDDDVYDVKRVKRLRNKTVMEVVIK